MLKYSNSGVNIAIYHDERKPLKDGNYRVNIRVTHQRKPKYYNTGVALSIEDFQRLDKARNKELTEAREIIEETFNRIKEYSRELINEGFFSFSKLNIRLGFSEFHSLQDLYDRKKTEATSLNTADWYRYSFNSISKFAGKAIGPRDITIKWLKKYEAYMIEKGRSYTTISMYLRALQSVINLAIDQGALTQHEYPFGKGKYEIPEHEGRKIALPLKQIGNVFNFDCLTGKELFCRDLWMFIYLCNGANIGDVARLKPDNIKGNTVQFYRQKTIAKSKKKKLVVAELTDEMKHIIQEHGSYDTEYLFPILSGGENEEEKRNKVKAITRSINYFLKKIGRQFGIDQISTYTARHSFATVLKRSGVNISFISESLGHSDIRVTENYLANFEDEEREKNAKLLTKFE